MAEEGASSEKTKACCVPGCEDRISKRHRFPLKNSDLFNLWLGAVKQPKFINMEQLQIYKSYYVCDRHFERKYIVPGTKRGLRKDACPTQFLPGCQEEAGGVCVAEMTFDQSIDSAAHKVAAVSSGEDPFEELIQLQLQEGMQETVAEARAERSDRNKCEPTMDTVVTGTQAHEDLPVGKVQVRKPRKNLLSTVGATRQGQLTPKCKKLYTKLAELSVKTNRLQHKIRSYQERLNNAEKFANSENFQNIMTHVNRTTYEFIMQQICNQHLPPKARRYTIDEKVVALSLLKASGKGYRLLAKIFTLPSRRTLTNMLNQIPLRPGFNRQMFGALSTSVQKLKSAYRTCAVLFDELKLEESLFYNKREDSVEGLEDNGKQRKRAIVDYVNVFMVKGLHKLYKQAVWFTFSSGPAKSADLKQSIVEVITACQNTGLNVVATICDQGGANQTAINALLADTRREASAQYGDENKYFGFLVNGKEIIPLYDSPHLLKCMRNNLLEKDLHFTQNGVRKIAKWHHIIQFYMLDQADNTRLCPKLTDRHVLKKSINKMKVSYAAQIFSHQLGALMVRIANWDVTSSGITLDKEASETGELLLFMDEVFDSLNGHTPTCPSSKPLKGGVTKTGPHKAFWMEAIKVFQSMKFYSIEKGAFVTVPTIKNFIHTLKGMIYLTEKLLATEKFKYVLPRSLNQDALENFFGCIRAHGVRNVSPDVSHFISSFKALLVNGYLSSHSPNFNCEEDLSCGAFSTLRCFLTGEEIPGIAPLEQPEVVLDEKEFMAFEHFFKQNRTRVTGCTVYYIAGYVASRALKFCQQCETCKKGLLFVDGAETQLAEFIEARQYASCRLVKPGSFLHYIVKASLSRLFYILPRMCTLHGIKEKLKQFLLHKLTTTPLNCKDHSNLNIFVLDLIVRCVLYFWVKRVNQILKGKDEKFVAFYAKLSKSQRAHIDPVKVLAHQKFLKSSKNKVKSRCTKIP